MLWLKYALWKIITYLSQHGKPEYGCRKCRLCGLWESAQSTHEYLYNNPYILSAYQTRYEGYLVLLFCFQDLQWSEILSFLHKGWPQCYVCVYENRSYFACLHMEILVLGWITISAYPNMSVSINEPRQGEALSESAGRGKRKVTNLAYMPYRIAALIPPTFWTVFTKDSFAIHT